MSKLYLGSSLIDTTHMGGSFQGKILMCRISAPWQNVINACKNGTYAELYPVGYTQELDLGSEGIVNMQVVAHDADELANGTGYAPLTWISVELLGTEKRINPALITNSDGTYKEGTGAIGGWAKSEIRTYMNTTIKSMLPDNLCDGVKAVKKTYVGYNTSGTKFYGVSEDYCWIPSYREIGHGSSYENSGPVYSEVFNSSNARRKKQYNSTSYTNWWFRSGFDTANFRAGLDSGESGGQNASTLNAIALGFCT